MSTVTHERMLAAIQRQKVAPDKMRQRLIQRCVAVDSTGTEEAPPAIAITYSDGRWLAGAAHICVFGDSPEDALVALLIRHNTKSANPHEVRTMMRMYRGRNTPTCNVLDFSQESDIDNEYHYRVCFSSSARLHRGDFEQAMNRGLRSGRKHHAEPRPD